MTMDNMFTADCKDCKDPHFCFYEGYCIHDEADNETKCADDPDTQQQQEPGPHHQTPQRT